jgi:hypothetical protein
LPDPTEIQIFPSLVAQPEPQRAEALMDAEQLAQQAAHHDHDEAPKRRWILTVWPRASRPDNAGASSRPPAMYAVATQKIASCRYHVRTMLLGSSRLRSTP